MFANSSRQAPIRSRAFAVANQRAAFRQMDPIVNSLRKHGRLAVPRVVHSDDNQGEVILTWLKPMKPI